MQLDQKKIMEQWDFWRRRIAKGDESSAPRDWFESILDWECPECEQNEDYGMNFCAFCGRQLWHKEKGSKDING